MLLMYLYASIIIIPRACTMGKAIGFVYRLSSTQKSPDLEFYTSMCTVTTTNW